MDAEQAQDMGAGALEPWITAVRIDLSDFQLLVQVAITKHDHPVGKLKRFVDVVRHEQDGRSVPTMKIPNEIVHPKACQGIECPEWLVEQHELRLPNERPSEGDSLCLTAG